MGPQNHTGCGLVLCKFVILTVACLAIVSDGQTSRMLAVKFLSYANKEGKTTNGICCDGMTQPSGDCVPDSCDTSFSICFRRITRLTRSTCDASVDTTTIIDNNTVAGFGTRFGNKPTDTPSLIAVGVNTMEELVMSVDVNEMDPGQVLLSKFSARINWTDQYSSKPDWHTFRFDSNIVSLCLNVSSFCAKYYYEDSCDMYCKPSNDTILGHFSCAAEGVKQCLPGWTGLRGNCVEMIDLCESHPCQNGASCSPVLQDYRCSCTTDYTGQICDTKIMPSTTAPTAPTTTTTTTTPTTTTPTTTTSTTTTPETTTSTSTPLTTIPTTTQETTTSTSTPMTTTPTTTPETTIATTITEPNISRTNHAQSSALKELVGMHIAYFLGPLFGLLLMGAISVVAYILFKRRERKVAPEKKKRPAENKTIEQTHPRGPQPRPRPAKLGPRSLDF